MYSLANRGRVGDYMPAVGEGERSVSSDYIFRWNRNGRKGQRCAVSCRGTMNSCLVTFEDGYTMVTSRNAIKKVV